MENLCSFSIFSPRRRKVAAQFYALPKCFKNVEVKEYEVARNDVDLICLKLRTAYTEPVLGTKEIKHLISLALDTNKEVREDFRQCRVSGEGA